MEVPQGRAWSSLACGTSVLALSGSRWWRTADYFSPKQRVSVGNGCGDNSKPFPRCFSDGAEEEKMETEAEGQPAEKVSWGLLAGGLWHFSPEFTGFLGCL